MIFIVYSLKSLACSVFQEILAETLISKGFQRLLLFVFPNTCLFIFAEMLTTSGFERGYRLAKKLK